MQGLLYGVRPEPWTPPDGANHLMTGLSRTPMRLQELDRPTPIRDDWAVAKTRLTGICGSDAKMVFMDFGDDFGDSALNGYFSFPTVFGHEVVADVVEVGPGVTRVKPGDPVMLIVSMKMQIPVLVEETGTLHQILVTVGDAVSEGQIVAILEK